MRADFLSELITAAGQAPQESSEIGYHTGLIENWDEITGANTVKINGQPFTNLRCLTSGAGILFAKGDTVVLMRMRTQYFIMGRIAAPGAGAALSTRAAAAHTPGLLVGGSSGVWRDLDTGAEPTGPTVSDVYIGTARRALVIISGRIYTENFTDVYMGFSVSGATTVAPDYFRAVRLTAWGATGVGASVSSPFLFGIPTPLLNPGLHTFQCKYNRFQGAADANFSARHLVVIPF